MKLLVIDHVCNKDEDQKLMLESLKTAMAAQLASAIIDDIEVSDDSDKLNSYLRTEERTLVFFHVANGHRNVTEPICNCWIVHFSRGGANYNYDPQKISYICPDYHLAPSGIAEAHWCSRIRALVESMQNGAAPNWDCLKAIPPPLQAVATYINALVHPSAADGKDAARTEIENFYRRG